jgi:hypothetical protein
MSNLPAPYLEDPAMAYGDESRARARIAQSLRRLSDALPPPSASDNVWQRLWENFSTQLVSTRSIIVPFIADNFLDQL